MMRLNQTLATAFMGMAIAFLQPEVAVSLTAEDVSNIALRQSQTSVALASSEVAKIAKEITVLIDSKTPGSGVIIQHSGNTYTVLTAAHVIAGQNKVEIITPDSQRYSVNSSTINQMSGVDLAVVQFTSSDKYSVAKIGDSNKCTEGTIAYVAGFPVAKAASISHSIYNFTDGKISAHASKPLKDGYALVYSNNTLPGMSGGPVFNEQGELVGVHGRADEADIETSKINPQVAYVKSGFNLGIPINTFLRLSTKSGVQLAVTPPQETRETTPKADDFYIQAGYKYQKGDYQGAIAAYSEAIRLNPKFALAYYQRGVIYRNSKKEQEAIADFQVAADLFTAQGNHGIAKRSQGFVRDLSKDYKGAIAYYNEALNINPNDAITYNHRGNAYFSLKQYKKAIADFDQAIKIYPNYYNAYYNRGTARLWSHDLDGAFADFDCALGKCKKKVGS